MKTDEVKLLSSLDRLLYWITERDAIRLRREAGESPPWTDDEILRRYRFCNVRRMDDRVSCWLLNNWYGPNFGHPNILVACALARFINLPPALDIVRFPLKWEPCTIKAVLRSIRAEGRAVFNGAYMIRGNDGIDKIESVVDFYVGPLFDDPPTVDPSSLHNTWQALLPRYGFGSFMAGQVVADLRWATSGTWSDKHTWAPIGPGSRRGMNRLHNRPPNAPLTQSRFLAELQTLMSQCQLFLPESLTRRLEAHDYQNCLCESDKYSRTLSGEGKPKQVFKWRRQ